MGVHEGAREGWLGAVGRPAEGWGTEVGRVWGGLRRRGAAWALWMREHSPPPEARGRDLAEPLHTCGGFEGASCCMLCPRRSRSRRATLSCLWQHLGRLCDSRRDGV